MEKITKQELEHFHKRCEMQPHELPLPIPINYWDTKIFWHRFKKRINYWLLIAPIKILSKIIPKNFIITISFPYEKGSIPFEEIADNRRELKILMDMTKNKEW